MVYFIAASTTDCVKIGRAKNVKRRLSALAIGCPHELGIIKTFQPKILSDIEAERWFHTKFLLCHIRGEWYAISPSDIEQAIQDFEDYEAAPNPDYRSATFMSYLMAQRRRSGLIGDLARDVDESEGDGIPLDTFLQWRQYLRDYGACEGALKAVVIAWWEYRALRRAAKL